MICRWSRRVCCRTGRAPERRWRRQQKSRLSTAFCFASTAHPAKRQTEISPGGSPCSGGGGQGFHLGGETALVASRLVLVEDALVGHRVHHGLHLAEEFGGLGLVPGENGFFDVLHRGAVFGAQRGIRGVDLDVLADALAARREARVLLFGFG